MSFDAVDKKFRDKTIKLECEECGSTVNVQLEPSRTNYPFEGPVGSPADPNRAVALCPDCAERYHEYWDERWREYHAGLL